MSATNSSIQEKTKKLNDLVAWFDSDDFILEMALDKYKQAETLANEIESDLLSLKNDIQVIKQKFDNTN